MGKNSEPAAGGERYIQIGVTALREPGTGEFLPEVPLYVRADDLAEEAEEQLISDFAKLMALKMRGYRDGCRKAGVAV